MKKHPQIKLQRFLKINKYEYEHLGVWYMKSTLYARLFNCNKIFERKRKQLVAKLRSLCYVCFVLSILFVLTLASERAVLHGDVAFQS